MIEFLQKHINPKLTLFLIKNTKHKMKKKKEIKMSGNIKKYNLEERLIQFTLLIMEIVEMLPNTRVGNHIAGQLLRCGSSPAFNYGEAQVAESRDDFIHKMKICLKELKDTNIALQIIKRKPVVKDLTKIEKAIIECKELISIFIKSVETARKNKPTKKLKHFSFFARLPLGYLLGGQVLCYSINYLV